MGLVGMAGGMTMGDGDGMGDDGGVAMRGGFLGAAHETLVIAAFPGPLYHRPSDSAATSEEADASTSSATDPSAPRKHTVAQVKGRPLWTNGKNDWTSVDYDEVNGRIALGTSGGRVVVMGI